MVIYRLAVYIKWRVECRTAGCKGSWDFISSQIRVLLFTGLIMSTRETRICALSQPTPPRRHPQLSFAPWMSDMIITSGRVATGSHSHINRHSAFSCSSTQTSPEEWSAEMRDCRGYDEAFNLAAELTLRSLKSLSAKLSQATWHQDGRTSEWEGRGGWVVQEEKPRGPLSSHALRTSCNCTRDGSSRTQRGYSNLWK